MEFHIHLLTWLMVFVCFNRGVTNAKRIKRDAAGALHIVTNHVQPIHADVKPENSGKDITDKPCPKNNDIPSHIEDGVVFQVTPPEDVEYQVRSLRKSLVDQPSKIDLLRNIGRVITMAVLVITAVLEFYPLLKSLCQTVYGFIYL